MPTDKPRLNVVLEPPLYLKVKKLAKRDGVSLSLKARDLIRESLVRDQAVTEPNTYLSANTKNSNEIKEIIRQHKEILEKKFKVKKIGVFGSYVRGEENKKSDLDVLVEFKKPVGIFAFMNLEEYLEKQIGIKIDLVSKGALKTHIGKRILKEVIYA